ncbi:MAG: hypothetical protein ACRDJM_06755, partial [Actinomycetota bacterium]
MQRFSALDERVRSMAVLAVGPDAGALRKLLGDGGFTQVTAAIDVAGAAGPADVVVLEMETPRAIAALAELRDAGTAAPVVAVAREAG